MAATNQNATMYAGQSFALSVPVRDKAGNPVAISGARYWLARTPDATLPVYTATSEYSSSSCKCDCDYGECCTCGDPVLIEKTSNDDIIISQAGGLYTAFIVFRKSDTKYLVGKFYHEIAAVMADGTEAPIAIGHLVIKPSPNRLVQEDPGQSTSSGGLTPTNEDGNTYLVTGDDGNTYVIL